MGLLENALVGGLVAAREEVELCKHYVEKKTNLGESFLWMGFCAILVMTFGLPQRLKEALSLARKISRMENERVAAIEGGVRGERRVGLVILSLCLFSLLLMALAQWRRSTLLLLVQFPFCVLLTLSLIVAGYRSSSFRPAAIIANVLLLPSVPAALVSLALSPSTSSSALSSVQPSQHFLLELELLSSSRLVAYALPCLLILVAPIVLLTANNSAALLVAVNVRYACPLLGLWYSLQVRWTVCLGLALYSGANLEAMLCPPQAFTDTLPSWAATLPIYRSAISLFLVVFGWGYTISATLAAERLSGALGQRPPRITIRASSKPRKE